MGPEGERGDIIKRLHRAMGKAARPEHPEVIDASSDRAPIDYRVGGAFRVQIDPGGVIADPIGDAVEVSGEMFGKFR